MRTFVLFLLLGAIRAEDDPIQPKARAAHILVKSEAQALELKAQLDESEEPVRACLAPLS